MLFSLGWSVGFADASFLKSSLINPRPSTKEIVLVFLADDEDDDDLSATCHAATKTIP
jgi:hypothetical protein